MNKIITPKQFFNHWARTNCDPEGNYLKFFVSGGRENSYDKWLFKHEISKEIEKTRLQIEEIRAAMEKGQMGSVKNGQDGVRVKGVSANFSNDLEKTRLQIEEIRAVIEKGQMGSEKNGQDGVRVKGVSGEFVKYKWVYDKTDCEICRSLDGRIFDEKPDIEATSHIGCKCRVVEVGVKEAENDIRVHKKQIQNRNSMAYYVNEGTKFDDKGRPKYEYLPTKNCGTYVRQAYEKATGVKIKKTNSAKDFGPSYKEVGFEKIHSYEHKDSDIDKNMLTGKFPQSYQPKKGDIIIFDKTQKHTRGHIATYNGQIWISDFKQKDAWGGPIRQEAPSYKVYRNPKWQDW